MNFSWLLVLCFAMGAIAGLRSLTVPAAVCLAAHLGWINLQGSKLAFLGSAAAVMIASALALLELFADKQSWVGARTKPGPLIDRLIMGGLAGAAFCISAGESIVIGAAVGAVGALAGTYGGYHARRRIPADLHVADLAVALVEDVVAIGGAFLVVSRFRVGN